MGPELTHLSLFSGIGGLDLAAARAFVEANYQGDPLLRHLYGTLLDKLPKVEAVEVVRCKDCTHFGKVDNDSSRGCAWGYCKKNRSPSVYEDDFCSYGERKDND